MKIDRNKITRHSEGAAAREAREASAERQAAIRRQADDMPDARVPQRRSDFRGFDDQVGPEKFLERVQALVHLVGYDFGSLVGVMYLAHGGSSDMTGAINYFKQRIDARVREIQVYSDGRLDVVYLLTDDQGWIGRLAKKGADLI